jgi:tetratricopeptide (TPR) repeat protein
VLSWRRGRGPRVWFAAAALTGIGLVGAALLTRDRGAAAYGSMLAAILEVGIPTLIRSLAGSVHAYLMATAGLLLPTVGPDATASPLSPWLRGTTASWILPWLGIAVWGIAVAGWTRGPSARRGGLGGLGLAAGLMTAMLILWPRMDRLYHPPLAIVAVGLTIGVMRLRAGLRGALLLTALVGHVDHAIGLASWRREESLSGFEAGRLLAERMSPSERALVELKGLFLESGRWQYGAGHAYLGVMDISRLEQTMKELPIRWIALSSRPYDPVLVRNPALELTPFGDPVRGPLVWRVAPNRRGVIARNFVDPRDAAVSANVAESSTERLARAQRAYERGDLEAAGKLSDEWFRGTDTRDAEWAVGCLTRVEIELELERFDEAERYRNRVLEGPSSDLYRQATGDLREAIAGHRRAASDLTPGIVAAERWEQIAKGQMQTARWVHAMRYLERAARADPRRTSVRIQRAFIQRIFGDLAGARAELDVAFQLLRQLAADPARRRTIPEWSEADELARMIEYDAVLADDVSAKSVTVTIDERPVIVDPSRPETWLESARMSGEWGLPGVEYRLLESGLKRFPESRELLAARLTSMLRFGEVDEANALLDARPPSAAIEADDAVRRTRNAKIPAPSHPKAKPAR